MDWLEVGAIMGILLFVVGVVLYIGYHCDAEGYSRGYEDGYDVGYARGDSRRPCCREGTLLAARNPEFPPRVYGAERGWAHDIRVIVRHPEGGDRKVTPPPYGGGCKRR